METQNVPMWLYVIARTKPVKVMPVSETTKNELQSKIHENVEIGSTVYFDKSSSYDDLGGMFYTHSTVNHSAKQYVDGMAHVNKIESVWALLKRCYKGVYHNCDHEALSSLCKRVYIPIE